MNRAITERIASYKPPPKEEWQPKPESVEHTISRVKMAHRLPPFDNHSRLAKERRP